MVATGAAHAGVYWWYTPFGDSNVIQTQTSPPGTGAYVNSWVGQNYLDTHMMGEGSNPGNGGGIAGAIRTAASGALADYCSAAKTGALTTATSGAYGQYTGFVPPSPLTAYQRRNAQINGSACQADRARWGFYLANDGQTTCTTNEACNMGHFVTMGNTGYPANTDNRPWSFAFDSYGVAPALRMKTTYTMGAFQDPPPYFALSFTCFVLQDMTQPQSRNRFLEACLNKWDAAWSDGASSANTIPTHDGAGDCSSHPAPIGGDIDTAWFTLPAYQQNPVDYATQIGSQGSVGNGSLGTRTVEFKVNRGQLKNIANNANNRCNVNGGRAAPLTGDASQYRLVGVADGIEAGGSLPTRFAGSHSLLQAWTEY